MAGKCQIVWNITSACNESCKFCFRKKCRDISLEENKKIVDKISNLDVSKLSLSGGETLLYDDLFELVEYIKLKLSNTQLVLNTNGKNIDNSTLDKIIEYFDAITLPIDSTSCDFNLEVGRGYDHNSNVLKIIEYCNNKIIIKINTIVLKNNIEEIDKIYDLIKEYNISRWKIFKFLPVRDAYNYSYDFSINDDDSNRIENKVIDLNNNSDIEISYNKEKRYKTRYFIYPDGTIENSKLEPIEWSSILD